MNRALPLAGQVSAQLPQPVQSSGETARWNREDFTGVLDDKFLPGWAREKLAELMTQEQTDAPTMGGMKMK